MSDEDGETFDYIVVGSGAGGGPLACNLARAGFRVLLMEAGDRSQPDSYNVPVFHPRATEEPSLRWDYYVRHYADDAMTRKDNKVVKKADPDLGDAIWYPRAGTLGGCTAHHAMITVYPHNDDWQYIQDLTRDESWCPDRMREYFEHLENNKHRRSERWVEKLFFWNPSRHGYEGWLPVTTADAKLLKRDKKLLKLLARQVFDAIPEIRPTLLRRLRGTFRTIFREADPNDWLLVRKNSQGIRMAPLSIGHGGRSAVRERIHDTETHFPDRLFVRTGALVTRVLFEKRRDADRALRALGVEYLDGKHLYKADPNADPKASPDSVGADVRRVYAGKEVILAGGAFNTPQLLMLSGIGPRAELDKHKINVLLDRKGVGENLQDRYEVTVISEAHDDFKLLEGATFESPPRGTEPDPAYKEYQNDQAGAYTTNGAVIAIIKKADRKSRELPDLFIFGLLGYFEGYKPGYAALALDPKGHNVFTWAILKAHTQNRKGTVRLRSANPLDTPLINFHYFEEGSEGGEEDLHEVFDGVKFVRGLLRGAHECFKTSYLPGQRKVVLVGEGEIPDEDEDAIREFIKANAWGHHASCTCQMGPTHKEMAVVDSKFRVIGTDNLRIVDASVFPRIPGFFIVLPIYMISEKASADIIADARRFTRAGAAPARKRRQE